MLAEDVPDLHPARHVRTAQVASTVQRKVGHVECASPLRVRLQRRKSRQILQTQQYQRIRKDHDDLVLG